MPPKTSDAGTEAPSEILAARAFGRYPVIPRGSFLVLEPDAEFAAAVARALTPLGKVVITHRIADALVATPPTGEWSAVVLASEVADGSGFALLDALRADDPELAAVVVATGRHGDDINPAYLRGATLLAKPFEPEHLDRFLRTWPVRARVLQMTARIARVAGLSVEEAAFVDVTEGWRDLYALTDAEVEVLRDSLRGYTRAEIAKRRGVAEGTVAKQINRVLRKSGDDSWARVIWRAMYQLMFLQDIDPRFRA
jgi:DNA-binding NarL/FixJ family response regulator